MEVSTETPKLQTPEDATYARNRNFKLKEHICTGDTCLLKNEKRKKERKKKKRNVHRCGPGYGDTHYTNTPYINSKSHIYTLKTNKTKCCSKCRNRNTNTVY